MESISLFVELSFVLISVWLGYSLWRTKRQIVTLRNENILLQKRVSVLEGQLAQALERITEYESDSTTDGLLERAVQGLVALGVPGIVLLVAVSISGFAGAAALTTALAGLGGPFGMIGGIGALLLLVVVSKALAEYGFPRIWKLVIRGLIAKGYTTVGIQAQVARYPSWVITNDLRNGIDKVLRENQDGDRDAGHNLRRSTDSSVHEILANSDEV